ncbi:nitroreductase family protein [Desulfomicrobium baculatum]|uniref:Nitroreductase n=1 Tax=Desulfomicrobium baculatum (strain DSM 4028 / VKM B-1378 / X) TaxID=525897 RepID=C7LX75_DESBD|nr:nitroreductase family protein [Desulfomicrobium baculatum]ACU88748.1 nitroreductase [Desulfomicrobium baculatum DSM 4028]
MLDFIIDETRCIQCGECAADCPVSIIDMDGGLPRIPEHRESYCIGCQHCLAVCPTAALSILGKDPDQSARILPPSPGALENLIKSRRSVRRFSPECVDGKVLDRLMDVVAHAPTGKNQRNLRFTLVDDRDVMEEIRVRTMEGIRKAVADDSLPDGMEFFAKMVAPYDQGRDIIYRKAPHMIIASAPRDSAAPDADPFIALSYFELMAHSLGLGTVWCGFARWALQSVVPELGRALGIPADHRSMYAMMFGYPAVQYARTVQRDVSGVYRVCLADLEGGR